MGVGKAGKSRDGFGTQRGAPFLNSALEGVCCVLAFALGKERTALLADCFFWCSSSTVFSKEILRRTANLTGRQVVSSSTILPSLSLLSAYDSPPLCHHVRKQYVRTYDHVSKMRTLPSRIIIVMYQVYMSIAQSSRNTHTLHPTVSQRELIYKQASTHS